MREMKIWIGGGIGHGKSTLARFLSQKLSLPLLEIDSVRYKDNYGNKYSEDETENKIRIFAKGNKGWIIEGSQRKPWIEGGFKEARIVLILNFNRFLAVSRFLKRQYLLFLKGNHQRKDFFKKISWIYKFEKDDLKEYINLICKYEKFYLILRNKKDVKRTLNYLMKRRLLNHDN